MNCFGGLSNRFSSEGSPIYLSKLGSKFSRTKSFCFENCILLAFGLGMCEGVGEDSRHGFGHVDIQVGSCICLSVIVFHDMCTEVGSNPCRKLSLLSFAHPVEGSLFQVQGVYRKTALTRGRVLEESQVVALVFIL